jgi:hypothetical protein
MICSKQFTLCECCGKQLPPTKKLCPDCETQYNRELSKLLSQGKPCNPRHIARKIFRKNNPDHRYLLRDIPSHLWQQLKFTATKEDEPVRAVIFKAVHLYLINDNTRANSKKKG